MRTCEFGTREGNVKRVSSFLFTRPFSSLYSGLIWPQQFFFFQYLIWPKNFFKIF